MLLLDSLKRRNVLRVAVAYLAGSWLLIQILDTLFPMFGMAETSIRNIVIVLAIGFIPVVIASWVFEITPDGIRRDYGDAAEQDPASHKAFDRIVIVTLTIALGYFAVDKFIFDPARDAEILKEATEQARDDALIGSYGDNSIAVLPFRNLSSDPEQEYFSEGIAEDLLNLLAKIPELRVISSSSSSAFKGRDIEIPEIAERLKVAHILYGSVRKAGDKIRVTTRLLDAGTDTQIWSETYDREFGDIFAIQDEISAEVVKQLAITILGEVPRAEPVDPRAYSMYLRARHINHTGEWSNLPLAEELIKEALAIEPDYPPALLELGRIYLNIEPSDDRSEADLDRLHRDVAARYHEIAADTAEDLVWRGWLEFTFDNDPAAAAPLFERMLDMRPTDPNLFRAMSGFLIQMGYLDEAIILAEYVLLRDPGCAICVNHLSNAYRAVGEPEKAVDRLREAIEWAPDRGLIYWSLGSALLQSGRPAEALEAFEKEQLSYLGDNGRLMALHDLGRLEQFAQEFEAYRADANSEPESIARIYAWIGDNDAALEWAERALDERGPDAMGIFRGGFYRELKLDPRFDALLRRYGQHPDQRDPIPFRFTPPIGTPAS